MEAMKSSPLKQQLDILWRPHPLLPAADCQRHTQEWQPGQTVREVLLANGVDPHQPIVIVLDDRLLTVAEWDTVCPQPGQIINVKAEVEGGGGGGGGSNALQIVAMIAIVVVAVLTYQYELLPAAFGMEAATVSAIGAGVIMVGGSMLVNSIFAAQIPSLDMGASNGSYSQASPTYSLSGGTNRSRPYESMPVLMGTHRHVPDNAAKPFTEYHGEDQYLYQLFHLGLSTAERWDWRVGTNPITNYQDYSWAGQDSQGRIGAFPGNVDSIAGAVLENSAGWITRTTSSNTYRIGVDVEGTLYYANNGGGLDATSVQLRVQYCESGSGNWREPSYVSISGSGFVSGHYENYSVWVESGDWGWTTGWTSDGDGGSYYGEYYGWVDTSHWETRTRFVNGTGGVVIISGASQAPRRATLFIDVPTGTYDVRVLRETGDATDARLQNKTNWSTLRSYQADTASYVGQNRLGLIIRASEQLNGTIQQLSYLGSAYAYYWNGSAWAWSQTSNPAHWFMDFARGRYDTNGRLLYGIGLSEAQLDLPALAAWANFCASEGLTFNAVLDSNLTSADVLTSISRCGLGSASWASGKLGVIWDMRNAAPVMVFGMSNIIRGTFEVNYITQQLAEEIIVQYINPANDWTQDEVRVLVPGITVPSRSSTVSLTGCTNAAMAGKFANYMAAQQYYRKRRIKWESDFEGFVCQRGDVVLLSHDLTQWGYSGRVVSVADNTLTLDRAVPRSGTTDYVMLKRPDGTMTTYKVTSETGDHDTVTLESAPSFQEDTLPMDHIWFFSPLPTPGKRAKIISISPVSDSRVQVIATDEDPQFYAAWDGTWQSPANPTLLKPGTPVIQNLKISERLAIIGAGQIVTRITFSWQQKSSQIERVELRYRINGGQWLTKTVFSGQSTDVDFDGFGSVEVSAFPINGMFVGSTISATGNVYGKTLPPENVQGFVTDPLASRFTLRWNKVGDIDLNGYQIRWINGDSRDWGQASPIHEGLIVSSPYISATRPAGRGTLMIKAIDTSGNESVTPAAIVLDLGDPPVANVIETIDLGARGFTGWIVNGQVNSGKVQANEQGAMWNANDAASMWHYDSASMWRAATYYSMVYTDEFSTPAGCSGSQLTLPATINADSWQIEYRQLGGKLFWSTDSEPMWSSNAAKPMYLIGQEQMWSTDSSAMWSADSTTDMWNIAIPFMAWPGAITAVDDTYELRIKTSFGANRGEISSLVASFDVPDIKETLIEVDISASGTRLPITKDYFAIKGVNLTLLAGTGNAFSAKVIDKNAKLGPLVMCYDLSGNPVAGRIDAEPYGY